MSARVRGFVVALAACVAATAVFAPAASAVEIRFDNWVVSGKLRLAKLKQDVTLPAGSTFNGSLETTTSRLQGSVAIPRFTSRLRVLGIVPVDATLDLVEAQRVTGTATLGAVTTINARSAFTIFIRRLASPYLPLNLVSSRCRTAAPVVLGLLYEGPLNLANGLTFTGTTTIPALTECGLTTSLLSLLMSGPGNPFSVTIKPPPAP